MEIRPPRASIKIRPLAYDALKLIVCNLAYRLVCFTVMLLMN